MDPHQLPKLSSMVMELFNFGEVTSEMTLEYTCKIDKNGYGEIHLNKSRDSIKSITFTSIDIQNDIKSVSLTSNSVTIDEINHHVYTALQQLYDMDGIPFHFLSDNQCLLNASFSAIYVNFKFKTIRDTETIIVVKHVDTSNVKRVDRFIQPYYEVIKNRISNLEVHPLNDPELSMIADNKIVKHLRFSYPTKYLVVYLENIATHNICLYINNVPLIYSINELESIYVPSELEDENNDNVFIIPLHTVNKDGINFHQVISSSIEVYAKKIDDSKPSDIHVYGISMQNLVNAEGIHSKCFL